MNLKQPEAVPLVEKLRWVPENFKFEWPCNRDENGNALGYTVYPAGKICHQAADRIAGLEAQLAEAREALKDIAELEGNPRVGFFVARGIARKVVKDQGGEG